MKETKRMPSIPRAWNLETLIVLGLCFTLFVSAIIFLIRVRGFVLPVLPRVFLFNAPDARMRAALDDVPYEVLRATDQMLPADARVLLVTDGRDARHREYTTFHRALYLLTPRAVYWMSPAPNDGTWEARWWTSAPLNEESVMRVAQATRAEYILLLANVNLNNATILSQWQEGKLFALASITRAESDTTRAQFADARSWWRGAFALAMIFLSGVVVFQMVAQHGFETTRAETLAVIWTLGAGIIAFGMVILSALDFSLQIQVVSLAVFAALGALGTGWRARGIHLPRFTFASSLIQTAFCVWLALQIIFISILALGQPLVFWDSWVTWGMKARAMFLEQTIGAAVFADSSRVVTHLDYPLLLPSLEAWLYQWLGAPDDRFVGFIALAFYFALLGLVYGAAKKFQMDATRALLLTSVVGSMPALTLLTAQVYADVPLAVYGLLTTLALLEWIERGERGALLVALFGAACLPWIKREGLIFLFAVGIAVVLTAHRTRRAWWGAFLCVTAGCVVAGAWSFFLSTRGVENIDFLPLTRDTFIANFTRAPTIAIYFAKALASVETSFVWVLIGMVFALRLVPCRIYPRDALLLAPLLYLALMASSFIFSAFTPFENHLASSGFRLLAHVTPLGVLWLASQMQAPLELTQRTV